jgi:RNA polymerase sigma-70 factor (ECF subfamily)
MSPDPSFAEWVARIRSGDADAAEQLFKRYEMLVRVAVRHRLTDPKLRQQFGSDDVRQSVMASFFVRAAAGQFDLETPQKLVALLTQMARHKCDEQIRWHRQGKRDVRKLVGNASDATGPVVADDAPTPSQIVSARELHAELVKRLGPEDQDLVRRRAAGQGWNDIARDLGGTPQKYRMRLQRAIDEIAPALGIVPYVEEGDE